MRNTRRSVSPGASSLEETMPVLKQAQEGSKLEDKATHDTCGTKHSGISQDVDNVQLERRSLLYTSAASLSEQTKEFTLLPIITGPGKVSVLGVAPARTALKDKCQKVCLQSEIWEDLRSTEAIWRDVLVSDMNSGYGANRSQCESRKLGEKGCEQKHKAKFADRKDRCLQSVSLQWIYMPHEMYPN